MNRSKYTVFDKVMLFGAFVAAVGLILGILAGSFNPKHYIILAFFGLAYLFFLWANLAFVLWWGIRRKWGLSMATLVLIFIGWVPLHGTYQPFGEKGTTTKSSKEDIRVMTYNVHAFKKYGENNDVSTKDQIVEAIKEQNPDIVCFQEFFTRYRGEFDLIDTIKKQLGLRHYYFLPSSQNDYEAFGLAIFSRYPIKNKGEIFFDIHTKGNGSIYIDIEVNNQLLRVYNVHLQSISFRPEDYEYIDMLTKNMNTEYKSSRRIVGMLKTAFVRRGEQVDVMKAQLRQCTTPYILAGDFNDTPASYSVIQLTDGLKRTFIEKGSGLGKTYNGAFPNFQIDYIAATKDFEVLNHYVPQVSLSDHFPVRSDLRLVSSK